jgi:hypothetical protein
VAEYIKFARIGASLAGMAHALAAAFPVGSARNKANFCVPLQGSKITVTGSKAFSGGGHLSILFA